MNSNLPRLRLKHNSNMSNKNLRYFNTKQSLCHQRMGITREHKDSGIEVTSVESTVDWEEKGSTWMKDVERDGDKEEEEEEKYKWPQK